MNKYRNYDVSAHKNGWCTTLPNDNNIYKSKDCALNAIDTLLDCGLDGKLNRHKKGVVVIARKQRK